MKECCQKCRKWPCNTWEPVPPHWEPGSALKIDEKLENCTQEPVPVWVGTGFPYIFPEACFWKLSGTGSCICRNRVLLFIFEKCQTLKIHNFQTVSLF